MARCENGPERPAYRLQTPCLLLDISRMENNLARLQHRIRNLGVRLRPHLKTAKSVEIARRMMETPAGPATVSTLREAEQFAAAGVRDLTYAVGISPNKLDRVTALRRSGVDLSVILDSVEQARFVADHARRTGDRLPVLIELDSDRHRAGVLPEDAASLVAIGRTAEAGGAALRGVLTHAGGSYDCTGSSPSEIAVAIAAVAEREREGAVTAAAALREAGFECAVVSVGSTPTAHFASHLEGVTEVRAGVYVFFDLVMVALGVCRLEDIAISVLATVIGHRPDRGWIFVDAGWMALSRDRGNVQSGWGYGAVCDTAGRPIPDLIVAQTSQEHGILALGSAHSADARNGELPHLPVGSQVRIFPNHACATAAQFDHYELLGDSGEYAGRWDRFGGW